MADNLLFLFFIHIFKDGVGFILIIYNMICLHSIIIVSLLYLTFAIEFHVSKVWNLPATNTISFQFTLYNLNVVQGRWFSFDQPPIYQGCSVLSFQNHQLLQHNFKTGQLPSQPKFLDPFVVINYGSNLTVTSNDGKLFYGNYKFPQTGLGVVDTNPIYTLAVPKKSKCASVFQFSTKNKTTAEYFYESGADCKSTNQSHLFRLFHSSYEIVLIRNKVMYFLHENLTLFDTITSNSTYGLDGYTDVSLYQYDYAITSTFLLSNQQPYRLTKYQIYRHKMYDDNDKKMYLLSRMARPKNAKVTGNNSAVSIAARQQYIMLYRWGGLSREQILMDYDKTEMLQNERLISVSPNENQFVVFNEGSSKISVYSFNRTSYHISKMAQISVTSGLGYQNFASYSADGSVLIVTDGKTFYRAYSNQSTLKFDKFENPHVCFQLSIVDMGSATGYLSVCHQGDFLDYVQWLELRSVQDFSLLDKYDINYEETQIYRPRIIGIKKSINKFNFVQYTGAARGTRISLMAIQNGKIVDTGIFKQDDSYNTKIACEDYIVTYVDYHKFQAYHIQNLSSYRNFSYFNPFQFKGMTCSKNILLINIGDIDGGFYSLSIYDLNKEQGKEFSGLFVSQYWDQIISYYQGGVLLLPETNIIYIFKRNIKDGQPVRLIYNLSNPSISQVVKVVSKQKISVYHYAVSGCGNLYFYSLGSKSFNHYKDCPNNINQVESVPLYLPKGMDPRTIQQFQFLDSMQNPRQYVVLNYKSHTSQFVDIRSTDSPKTKDYLHQIFDPYKSLLTSVSYRSHRLTMKFNQQVQVLATSWVQKYAGVLGIDTIYLTDLLLDNSDFLFIGTIPNNSTHSRMIANRFASSGAEQFIDLPGTYHILKVLRAARFQYIAAVYQRNGNQSTIKFFYASPYQQIILKGQISTSEDVVSLSYPNKTHLLVVKKSNYELINITDFKTTKTSLPEDRKQRINSGLYRVAVNFYGTLFAETINNTDIQIRNQQHKHFANFHIDRNDMIVDMKFNSQDHLHVLTYAGKFYRLQPSPCPDTFLNVDSYCVCRQNFTIIGGLCDCKQNFNKVTDQCICKQSFEFKDGQCSCSGYVESMECNHCSSWCDTCSGPGLQCIEYASLFYGIVIGGSIFVLLILVGIGVFCVIRKRKQKESILDQYNEKKESLAESEEIHEQKE